MIAFAYGLAAPLITGGPSWTPAAEFDLQAKAEDPATATVAQFRLMFQSLLSDRFKLTFHKEAKELPGYVLSITKSGAKLGPADGEEISQRTINRSGDSELHAEKTSISVLDIYSTQ